MTARRAHVLIGVGGAAVGALWAGGLEPAVAGIVLGGALATSFRYPLATSLLAAAVLLATVPRGTIPGGDSFAAYALVAAHAFSAGRAGVLGGLVALLGASVVCTILSYESLEAGVLFIALGGWAAGRALGEREQVAAQLAERARELEQEHDAHVRLSVRYERARVASELHDIVAHAITVMVVQADAGRRMAAHDPQFTVDAFEAIAGAAYQAEEEMGRLVALLADEAAIGRVPDLALIEELVARSAAGGLDVTLRLEGERDGLPAALVRAACRVVQEGMTNALRYAAGAAVSVVVRGEDAALVVEVTNAPAVAAVALAGSGTRTGLRGLRELVGACGGTLDAGPLPDGGWLLSARLPLSVATATP